MDGNKGKRVGDGQGSLNSRDKKRAKLRNARTIVVSNNETGKNFKTNV